MLLTSHEAIEAKRIAWNNHFSKPCVAKTESLRYAYGCHVRGTLIMLLILNGSYNLVNRIAEMPPAYRSSMTSNSGGRLRRTIGPKPRSGTIAFQPEVLFASTFLIFAYPPPPPEVKVDS